MSIARSTSRSGEQPGQSTGAQLRRLWHLIRPHRRLMLVGGSLGLAANAAALAQPLVARRVIDSANTEGGDLAVEPLVLLIGLLLVGSALAALGAFVLERVSADVVHGVRDSMIRHVLWLRVSALRSPGDLITRVTADTTLLSRVASTAAVEVPNAVIMMVGSITLMAFLDIPLLSVAIGVLLSIFVVGAVAMPRIATAQEQVQVAVGEIGTGLERVLGALRTVKASGAESAECARLAAANADARTHMVTTAKWTALARIAAGTATQVSFLAVLGFGGARVASGQLQLSDLIAFLLYLFGLTQPIGILVQGVTELQAALAATRRVTALEELPVEAHSGEDIRCAVSGPASIEFDDVHFSYEAGLPILQGLSFDISGGQVVAIVGPSGEGKTTVFSLLERFFDVDSGVVKLDGKDVAAWPLSDLRQQIGYVEQDAPVFEGTLRANLTYAEPGACDSDLNDVVRRARLSDLIERAPLGLDTPLGPRGLSISGGQRQRIAIARALLRRPRVLLLDEATSQLDAENEQALRETIRDVSQTMTVILIAHRMTTVTGCDEIIVLSQGRVHAQGEHSELLNDPLYARLAGVRG